MKTTRTNLFQIGVGAFLSFSPLFVNNASASTLKCSAIFSNQSPERTTEQINQAIAELSALRLALDKTQAQGARSVTHNFLQKDFEKKHAALVNYVEKHQIMTRAQLLEKIQQEIVQLQKGPVKKDDNDDAHQRAAKTTKQLQDLAELHKGHKLVPQRIEAGQYIRHGNTLTSFVEKPFELMSTPTTQIVWRKVVELLQQRFPGEYDLVANPSENKNDLNPVESISFNDVEFWLWGLNQLSQMGEPALTDIIVGHKPGDHYRLPRDKEWEYVVHAHKREELESRIDDYAWYDKSSASNSQPVGLKLPISKNGNDFYDLLGNVTQMMDDQDMALGRAMRQNERPQRGGNAFNTLTRGGSYDSWVKILFEKSILTFEEKDKLAGFRLVRDIEPLPRKPVPAAEPVSIAVTAPAPTPPPSQASVQAPAPVPVHIPQPVLQQAPVQVAPPVVPQKTSLWKKITGKLGW